LPKKNTRASQARDLPRDILIISRSFKISHEFCMTKCIKNVLHL
jgi:hypothetical protein